MPPLWRPSQQQAQLQPQQPQGQPSGFGASDKGAILIAAAGNAGPKSPLYPAANPYVIAVTATDMDDKVFSGANRGKHVAIAALVPLS